MTVLANLLPKDEVLQDLNISEETFESHLQKCCFDPSSRHTPAGTISSVSLMHRR